MPYNLHWLESPCRQRPLVTPLNLTHIYPSVSVQTAVLHLAITTYTVIGNCFILRVTLGTN